MTQVGGRTIIAAWLIVSRGRTTARIAENILLVPVEIAGGHPYPFRVPCRFQGRDGYVVLDQLRTVDQERLLRLLGRLPADSLLRALQVLCEMFAP